MYFHKEKDTFNNIKSYRIKISKINYIYILSVILFTISIIIISININNRLKFHDNIYGKYYKGDTIFLNERGNDSDENEIIIKYNEGIRYMNKKDYVKGYKIMNDIYLDNNLLSERSHFYAALCLLHYDIDKSIYNFIDIRNSNNFYSGKADSILNEIIINRNEKIK